MRATFSTLAVMAISLLAREVIAAPHGHAHANAHPRRDYFLDTDNVIITEEIWVSELADGSYVTGAPVAVGTTTIDGSAVLVTETATPTVAPSVAEIKSTPTPTPTPSTSSTPIPTPASSSAVSAAVFIEEAKPSSTLISIAPTKSADPIVVPTTTSKPIAVPVPTTLATSVQVAPTTSPLPVATKAASSSASGKRGAAYNDVSLLAALSSSSEVSWAYNWGSTTPSGVPSNMEYTPMLWGLQSEHTHNWDSAVATARTAGSKHLLYVNEPDYSGQSNIDPTTAATGYLQYFQPLASEFTLVGPAITNGGLSWLTEFVAACSTCTIHAQAVHWYNGGTAENFKEYMAKAYAASGNRPLWVTEFEAPGSPAEQTVFLQDVMAWMDETDYIERYAYFGVFDGNLVSGSSLSSLGKAYASSS